MTYGPGEIKGQTKEFTSVYISLYTSSYGGEFEFLGKKVSIVVTNGDLIIFDSRQKHEVTVDHSGDSEDSMHQRIFVTFYSSEKFTASNVKTVFDPPTHLVDSY